MSLALVSRRAALLAPWNRNELWRRARAVPSLDLRFAENKSLVDATTGQNLVTFTRASSGTYVDSTGTIRTATTNLLVWSNGFDTTWNNSNSSGTAASGIAPDGSNTAWELKDTNDVSAVTHRISQGSISMTAALPYTFSIFVKAGTLSQVRIIMAGPVAFSSGNKAAFFDMNTNTFSNISTGTTPAFADIGQGWKRISITATTDGTGTGGVFIDLVSGSPSYQGDGTGTILIWGAQLEQSSTVGEYIPTTSTINSAPRFDHDPTTGESLGLLVEESRTNYIPYSETILSNTTFGVNRTIVDNVAVAPDGTTTAASVTATAADPYLIVNTATGASAGTYTFSVYLKGEAGNSSQLCRIRIEDAGTGLQSSAQFNITTEWKRYSFTATTTGNLQNVRLDIPDFAVSGDIVYVWGLQIEEGSFPTSYIPTTGTTATRAADVASIAGTNFSSWYRQDEGSFFWSGDVYNTQYSGQYPFRVTQGSTLRGIGVGLDARTGTDNAVFQTRNSSGLTTVSSAIPYVIGNSNMKIAGAFGVDVAAAFNGSDPVIASPSYSFGTEDRMEIMGSSVIAGTNNPFNGHTRRLVYWSARLPDSTLQTITQ